MLASDVAPTKDSAARRRQVLARSAVISRLSRRKYFIDG